MVGGSCDLLIFDSRLLWQTVSNADDKTTATQIVRSGGFLWLNPIAISVVICSRLEIFVDSGQNQRLQYFRDWVLCPTFGSAINSFNGSPQLGDICLLVQDLNKIFPFLPFMCVDAVLDVII